MVEEQAVFIKRVGKPSVAFVVLLALAGCGYHLKGTGLMAPPGVSTVFISVLENRTSESGIETVFARDLAYEFTRSHVLKVVNKDRADTILSGSITSLDIDTISHTSTYEAGERRVTITLDLTLKRVGGEVIWSDKALLDREAYKVSSGKLTTEENRRTAIEALSKRVAERVHNRILQDF